MMPSRRITRYFSFARIAFRDHIRHRLRFAVRFLSYMLFAVVFIELWRTLAREGIVRLPYALTDLCWYGALSQMMLFLSPRLFMVIDDDMRSGNIAYFLGRPIPYLWMRFAEGVGAMTSHALVYYGLGIPLLYAYIGDWPSRPEAMLPCMALLYGASLVHLIFQMTAGLTALWLQDADTLYRIYQKSLIVLGGLYLPLTMYPLWVREIALLTPFPAMIFGPVGVVLGDGAMPWAETAALLALWLALSVALMQTIYAVCLRRIEINGG